MPRAYDILTDDDKPGTLIVETPHHDYAEVFYAASKERLDLWRYFHEFEVDSSTLFPDRVKLLEIDGTKSQLTMFPLKTRVTDPYLLTKKYDHIERITIADNQVWHMSGLPSTEYEVMMLLEDLPSCFIKDYDYGLGLLLSYRCIVDSVENLSSCSEIHIAGGDQSLTGVTSNVFHISTEDFEEIRKSIDRTMRTSRIAARSVKRGITYNFFAEKLGRPPKSIPTGRSPLRQQITSLALGDSDSLSRDDHEAIIDLVTQNAKAIANANSEKLASLQRDIDIVTLDNLIGRYEVMIDQKLPEGTWQTFLNTNHFILTLAFGYPIIKMRGQASVGGRQLGGKGEKITDFLVKNSMTNNTTIIEIKKPTTRLLTSHQMSSGIYTPSGDLVGAINQALDQKQRFEQDIAQTKVNSRIYDMESYSVHCCLIVGKIPPDEERKRSFEMFRGNSKNVEIITFDELLEKLKQLRDFLNSPEPELQNQPQSFDLPF